MSFKTSFWASLSAYLVGKIVYTIIAILIFIIIIGIVASSLNLSGDEEQVNITEPVFLKINLQGSIADRKKENPLKALTESENSDDLSLQEIKEALDFAKTDPLVKGVLLDFSNLSSGIANIEELRNEIIDFRLHVVFKSNKSNLHKKALHCRAYAQQNSNYSTGTKPKFFTICAVGSVWFMV